LRLVPLSEHTGCYDLVRTAVCVLSETFLALLEQMAGLTHQNISLGVIPRCPGEVIIWGLSSKAHLLESRLGRCFDEHILVLEII
jgi:hypothetical protein